jgi:hypothetical protein
MRVADFLSIVFSVGQLRPTTHERRNIIVAQQTTVTSQRGVEQRVQSTEETTMPVAMLIDNPDGSQQIYEQLREHLGVDRPVGGIVHIAGPSPNGGWRVIEVWESEEEAKRFLRERFAPALKAVGFSGQPPQPQFWRVHSYLK